MSVSRLLAVSSVLLFTVTACWPSVPDSWVCGTYVASYPRGTDTIVLQADGRYVQTVSLAGEAPVSVRGDWTPNGRGHVLLRGGLAVLYGEGELPFGPDGPIASTSMPLEVFWFRVVMNSGASYPYLKTASCRR